MRIVTVHTPGALHPETRAAIEAYREDADWVVHEIDAADEFAYGRILRDYWEQGESFINIEPDIVPRPDVFEALNECGCEYGAFPYSWGTDVGVALGCTWWKDSFIARYPNAMREAVGANVGFRQLDVVFQRHILARNHGEQPHMHLPAVEHKNPSKQLLPEASPVPLTTVPNW